MAGNNQDGERNQIDAVAIPQLLELFAPDFLVHFMKNIGHDSSNLPWPTWAELRRKLTMWRA